MDLASQLKSALGQASAEAESGWQLDGICKGCGFNHSACQCAAPERLGAAEHRLTFRREKRKGKVVTLVGPFAQDAVALNALCKRVKSKLARGGSAEGDFLLFQGECEGAVREVLVLEGYGFKR